MMSLLEASTKDLETLAKAIERKSVRFPLSGAKLRALGAARLEPHLALLGGLDAAQAQALLSCVLAERRQQRGPRIELVWTGPDLRQSVIRDTGIVVRDLFEGAQRSVLIGGCYFTEGEDILKPLYRALRERDVQATFCMNIPRMAPRLRGTPGGRARADVDAVTAEREHVRSEVRTFLAKNWPFGPPLPEFYYDPRTLPPNSKILLHSKCIVVDERVAFISSANFTHNGQERNIETGVQIDDERFARELAGHWRSLIGAGLLRRFELDAADIDAAALDVVVEQWNELRDWIDPEYLPLFDELKTCGLPPPTDADYELTWRGRVSDGVAVLYWENDGSPVGLCREGVQADNLSVVQANPDAIGEAVAAELRRRWAGEA